MSLDALPNDLLLEILSYLSWSCDKLLKLSLVNRRWNQVIGQMATLKISESMTSEDICVPMKVLCGSSREYRKFSCSMYFMGYRMMTGTFREVLEYCGQRWDMNALHIQSRYDKFIPFLQHHKHILNNVVRAYISVNDFHFTESCSKRFKGSATHLANHDFFLPMENLLQLNLIYEASSICSLRLQVPKLKILNVDRCMIQNAVHLTLHDSSKLRSVLIRGTRSSNSTDPEELQSILPQASKIRLKMWYCAITSSFSSMFGNLRTIILTFVKITPAEDPLECLNLTELQLRCLTLQKPIKLRVPQLRTLICDTAALKSLHLHDALKAELVAVDLTAGSGRPVTTIPVGLSSFRKLHLLLWCYLSDDDTDVSWLYPYLSGIMEIKLQSYYHERKFHRISNTWKHFPRLNTLRLFGMDVPDNLKFLPVNVQNVSMENCSTEGSCIEFPTSVERVQLKKLWNQKRNASSAGITLLPANKYTPLKSEILRVMHNCEMVTRMAYSTQDCNEMENFNPLWKSSYLTGEL